MDQPLPVELYDLRLLRIGHAALVLHEDRASLQDLRWRPIPWFSTVRSLAVEPGGGAVVVAGDAGVAVLSPDLQVCRWRDPAGPMGAVDWGRSGIAALRAGELRLLDADGELVQAMDAPALGLAAPLVTTRWHPELPWLAVADKAGAVSIVEVQDGRLRVRGRLDGLPSVTSLAWRPGARTLALGGHDATGTSRVWLQTWAERQGEPDPPLQRLPFEFPEAGDDGPCPCAVGWSSDGSWLFAASAIGRIQAWSPRVPEIAPRALSDEPVSANGLWIASRPDGERIAAGSTFGYLGCNLPDGEVEQSGMPLIRYPWGTDTGAWDGRVLLAAQECLVARWGFGRKRFDEQELAALAWGLPVTEGARKLHAALSPSGRALAISVYDRVTLWRIGAPRRPTVVHTWEAADIAPAWHDSETGLRLRLDRQWDTDWWTLDRCEHEAGPEVRPPRATDVSFSRRPSQSATHLASGLRVQAPGGERLEVVGVGSEAVLPVTAPGLLQAHDLHFREDGTLLVVASWAG